MKVVVFTDGIEDLTLVRTKLNTAGVPFTEVTASVTPPNVIASLPQVQVPEELGVNNLKEILIDIHRMCRHLVSR